MQDLAPDIMILEVGIKDLVNLTPEVVGSEIDELVRLLSESYLVHVVGVCHVIPRGASYSEVSLFARQALLLKQYLDVVLDLFPRAFAGPISRSIPLISRLQGRHFVCFAHSLNSLVPSKFFSIPFQ